MFCGEFGLKDLKMLRDVSLSAALAVRVNYEAPSYLAAEAKWCSAVGAGPELKDTSERLLGSKG